MCLLLLVFAFAFTPVLAMGGCVAAEEWDPYDRHTFPDPVPPESPWSPTGQMP